MAYSPLELATEQVIDQLERQKRTSSFFNDAASWAKYMLDVDLWSKQREIAESVVHNRNVAVKAGHGMGKSFLVAILACWWVDTRYPHAVVASTAPSTQQIGAIVWKEIRRINNLINKRYAEGIIDHKLPGTVNSDVKDNKWTDNSGVIIGFGKKPPDNKEDDSFQGIHDGYVLAIGDEACGLSKEIIGALGNITSNEGSRRILIANPTNPGSYFATLFAEDKGWAQHTISVFDSPAFTGEKVSEVVLSHLSGKTYVEDMAKEYKEDSSIYISRVLGEFAFDGAESLISAEDYAQGFDAGFEYKDDSRPVLGVDVARSGKDKSVIYQYRDGILRLYASWGGRDVASDVGGETVTETIPGTETANRIHRAALDTGAWQVRIDGIGLGGPIADYVGALSEGKYQVIAVNGAWKSPDRFKWHNMRAYWYDKMRSMLRGSQIDVDPNDTRLATEMCSFGFYFNKQSGGLVIESKEDMRARGMKSPDFADAAVYACADLSELEEDPLAGHIGERFSLDPHDIAGDSPWSDMFPW